MTRLVVRHVPPGSTVTVACTAPGRKACPFRRSRTRHRAGAERLDLRARVGKRVLSYGTVVTVRVSDTVRRLSVGRR